MHEIAHLDDEATIGNSAELVAPSVYGALRACLRRIESDEFALEQTKSAKEKALRASIVEAGYDDELYADLASDALKTHRDSWSVHRRNQAPLKSFTRLNDLVQFYSKSVPPSLILLDLELDATGKKSGILALRKLKRLYPNVPVVMFSQHNEREYVHECYRAGANEYHVKGGLDFKPVLVRILSHWLRSPVLDAGLLSPAEIEIQRRQAKAIPSFEPDAELLGVSEIGFQSDEAALAAPSGQRAADVNALSSLIAAKSTAPPLSICVFGGWGAGKTTFMRQIESRTAELTLLETAEHYSALASRVEGYDPELQKELIAKSGGAIELARQYGNCQQAGSGFLPGVASVWFNSWVYLEEDLWAAVSNQILNTLSDDLTIQENDQELAELHRRRKKVIRELSSVRRELSAGNDAHAEICRETVRVQRDLNEAKASIDNFAQLPALAVAAVKALNATGLLKADETSNLNDVTSRMVDTGTSAMSIDELKGAVEEISTYFDKEYSFWFRFRSFALSIFRNWISAAFALLGLLFAAIFYFFGTQLFSTIYGFAMSLAGVIAPFLVGAVYTGEKARSLFKNFEKDAISTQDSFQKLADRYLLRRKTNALEALESAKIDFESRLKALDSKSRELSSANALLEAQTSLSGIIKARNSEGVYSEKLGLMSTARSDFESLSRRINFLSNSPDNSLPTDLQIRRIVLYIDDIDRCTSKRIVEVLRVIHLLLHLDIFVVVVAMELEVVVRALRDEGLCDTEADALRYLDKIFQIPYRLENLSDDDRRSVFRNLRVPYSEAADSPGTIEREEIEVRATPKNHVTEVEGSEASASGQADKTSEGQFPPSIDLTEEEWALLEDKAVILSQTPRAMKRFSNIYRIVKASFAFSSEDWPLMQEKIATALAARIAISTMPGTEKDTMTKAAEVLQKVSDDSLNETLRAVIDDLDSSDFELVDRFCF